MLEEEKLAAPGYVHTGTEMCISSALSGEERLEGCICIYAHGQTRHDHNLYTTSVYFLPSDGIN
jgi:hypothetical protein